MLYWLAANGVILLHFAFVLFVVLGGILVWKWRWMVYLHVPAALWGALVEYQGWICPLTPLEQHLRKAAGMEGYSGSFIEHYIMPVLYPAHLTRDDQLVLGSLVVIINIALYGKIIVDWRKAKNSVL